MQSQMQKYTTKTCYAIPVFVFCRASIKDWSFIVMSMVNVSPSLLHNWNRDKLKYWGHWPSHSRCRSTLLVRQFHHCVSYTSCYAISPLCLLHFLLRNFTTVSLTLLVTQFRHCVSYTSCYAISPLCLLVLHCKLQKIYSNFLISTQWSRWKKPRWNSALNDWN